MHTKRGGHREGAIERAGSSDSMGDSSAPNVRTKREGWKTKEGRVVVSICYKIQWSGSDNIKQLL